RSSAAGHLERSDLRGIARRVLLEVVTDVPHCAVVVRIEGRCCVVLPPQRIRLRALALRQNRLREGQLAERIVRLPAGKALTGEVRRTAERIPDADVAELVDRAAGHPPVVAVAEIRSLLVERDGTALLVYPELIPAYAAAAGGRRDRVRRENRLVVA